ncbi:MAG: MATE family efflux transporter [Oscillospiraceae bacterium]|nr:MATE family efflux transporter [Oscillospiraceae bacterium]
MFNKKQLQALIIPLVIEQFLAMAVGAADTVMVSSCGEAAVSAVSLVDSINILLINIFSALATGGAVVASQYLGRQDLENARVSARQLIYAVSFLSLVVMALSLIFRRPILSGIFGHIEAEVMDNALIYFLLSAVSYPFLALYNSGAALFRSMGNSKVSMLASLLMNLVNVAGNAIFIYGFGMGVAGAATASLIARMLAAAIMLVLLHQRQNPLCIQHLLRIRLHFGIIRSILKVGVPTGLENGLFQVGKLLVASLIAGFGTVSTAANAIANTLCSIAVIPGSAIGLAMITVVGQCVGAGDYKQTRHYAGLLMKLTYAAMAVTNLLIILFSNQLVGCFGLSAETAALGRTLTIIHSAMAIPLWPASFTLPNALRAAGDARFTMVVSMTSMWICRIGLSFLLGSAFGLGVIGIWIAMTIDWIARVTCFVWRWKGHKWEQMRVI